MTSISDYSDKPQYTIKKVSLQVGIPSVTLRAWENRYGILTPHRSENRYRLYSDRDIAILRWLKSRVYNGISISSAVSELRQLTEHGQWPDAIPTDVPKRATTAEPSHYARGLYQALVHHDEVRAGDLLRFAFTIFDLKTITTEVITPCLVEIGEAWARGDIRITTEHFASAYLRGKLLTLLQAYPPVREEPLIMVGSAPTEEHEIGALMMAVLLRSEGYGVEYLGANIHLDDLVEHARYEKPTLIILTATTRPAALEMKRMQEKVNRLRAKPLFGYGGFAFNLEPDLREQVPGIFLGESMGIALETIETLLHSRQ